MSGVHCASTRPLRSCAQRPRCKQPRSHCCTACQTSIQRGLPLPHPILPACTYPCTCSQAKSSTRVIYYAEILTCTSLTCTDAHTHTHTHAHM
jgi:hypothetical protein